MTYSKLLQYPKGKTIHEYMRDVKATGDNFTSPNGMNFIQTKLNIFVKNGKKQKIPCFLRYSGIELKYSVWGAEEVMNHNHFLENTKKQYENITYSEDCSNWIILPNNCEINDNMVCLDIDDVEEIERLEKMGFPFDKIPFTRSSTKGLPHCWFYTDLPIQQIQMKKRFGRDIDLVRNYVYEKQSSLVYNPQEKIPTIKVEDLAKYLEISEEDLTQPYTYSHRKITEINKISGSVVETARNKKGKKILDIKAKKFEPTWEIIPYTNLNRIIQSLPVEEYRTHSEWYKIVRVVIAMIGSESNPNDYLEMFNMWVQTMDSYNESYDEENLKLFIQVLNENSYKNFNIGSLSSSEWLFEELYKHNKALWKELAFLPTRHLDPVIFDKLDYQEAVEVFNNRVGYIGSGINLYVEYNHESNQFIFHKKQALEEEYGNLYSVVQIPKVRKGKVEMEDKEVMFIKKWIIDKNRKTYKGGVVFNPPPEIVKNTTFNLFTGFEIENIEHFYDSQIEMLSKEQLEEELSFMLQHLKYLSGEDKTEQVYKYNLYYFAHLLKFPAILPRICLVWTSIAGVGKNQWLNFIAAIIGSKYYHSTANTDELLGQFNTSIRGKLLINLNEFKNNADQLAALKELITEEYMDTREKHKGDMRVKNCIRPVMTTNDKKVLTFEFKIRRFQVNRCNPITASEEFKFEKQYGKELHANSTSLWQQKCFLAYCRKYVEVTKNYNFETNRIITDEFLLLRSRNVPYFLRFLRYLYNKKDCKKYTSREMYSVAKQWLIDDGEKFSISLEQLTQELDTHSMRQTDQSYLNNNIPCVFHNPKYKQKCYMLDMLRCKEYLKEEFIEVTDFLASSDEEDTDSENEEDE